MALRALGRANGDLAARLVEQSQQVSGHCIQVSALVVDLAEKHRDQLLSMVAEDRVDEIVRRRGIDHLFGEPGTRIEQDIRATMQRTGWSEAQAIDYIRTDLESRE